MPEAAVRTHSLLALPLMVALLLPSTADAKRELRACADPNNLPYSNDKGEGFENKIAEIIADEMNAKLTYTWWAQRRGFIRNTLDAYECDLVLGISAGHGMVVSTRPYYRSHYVFVSRKADGLELASIRDPRLRDLKIGVQLIGEDYINTPPAHALGMQGIVDNVSGYMVYGDGSEAPQAPIISAVAKGEIDVAAVWGPLAGYYAKKSDVALDLVRIPDNRSFGNMRFEFDVAMGVRKGDLLLQREIDSIIEVRADDISAVLTEFGVPQLEVRDHAY
jgi:mxaJ protein